MNKLLLENMMMFNDGLEKLDIPLFKSFLSDLEDLHELVSKEKDPLLSKETTVQKIEANDKLANTLKDLLLIVKLDFPKKTYINLLKEALKENIAAASYFSVFTIVTKGNKINKKEQEEIFKILSEEIKKEPQETVNSVIFLSLLHSCSMINAENVINSKADFSFDFYHEYNKSGLINFNDLSTDNFLLYIIKQFKGFNLYKPMSLQKNDTSLESAIKPYLEQDLNESKKELLVYFLITIRDKLKLDSINNEFLDKLYLNFKLSTNLNKTEESLTKSIKKNKI